MWLKNCKIIEVLGLDFSYPEFKLFNTVILFHLSIKSIVISYNLIFKGTQLKKKL
jgi:hypothetical protein